jgi:aminopeptidase-like protein
VICPELYGTLFWLKEMPLAERRNQAYAIMLKSVGNREALSLQKTFTGSTLLDRAAAHYFRLRHPGGRIGDFRTVYGNDETVFEAPGFEIPAISMTRYPTDKKGPGRYPVPYPEYHTSMDDHRQILESHLEEAVQACLGVCDILENDAAMARKFEGLLCLSNPKYDLYQRTWDPANPKGPGHGETDDWHYLMNCVMRYFDGKTTVLDVAERHGLPFDAVFAYLKRFEAKGLIEFIPKE